MIGALLGITGKLKTLTDRLTSGRATALDYLDAAVTSRAPSSTALSTAQWTNTRAGYLDTLATAIPSSFIQSIQTGYASSSSLTHSGGQYFFNTPVTAVVVAKSFVFLQGYLAYASTTPLNIEAHGFLTSTTNLRISVPDAATYDQLFARYYVIEFK